MGAIHANTARVFHIETIWKRLFPRRFNVNKCGVFVGKDPIKSFRKTC